MANGGVNQITNLRSEPSNNNCSLAFMAGTNNELSLTYTGVSLLNSANNITTDENPTNIIPTPNQVTISAGQ